MKLFKKNALINAAFMLTLLTAAAVITLEITIQKVNAQETNPKEYHIAQDGTGDFDTIQAGVDYAESGDTLWIHPGTYNEHVSIIDKELYLVGMDKETCIVQCDTADYRNAVLAIAAGGVSNLTIIGIDTGIVQEAPSQEELAQIGPDLWEILQNYAGYAIHIEQDFLFQRNITISDCNIISQHNYCVGIGSRGGCRIIFENCSLAAMGTGGCVLLHDSVIAQFAGESDFIMRNCSMKSYLSPYIMAFRSLTPGSRLNLTFQNVKSSAMAYANDAIYQGSNVNTSCTVEETARFEKSGILKEKGLTTSAERLVHVLDSQASVQYMTGLLSMYAAKDYGNIMAINLPEGIIYIDEKADTLSQLKHQVISIENASGQAENGWCGLYNARLTPDSFGNTLTEMNAVLAAFE